MLWLTIYLQVPPILFSLAFCMPKSYNCSCALNLIVLLIGLYLGRIGLYLKHTILNIILTYPSIQGVLDCIQDSINTITNILGTWATQSGICEGNIFFIFFKRKRGVNC